MLSKEEEHELRKKIAKERIDLELYEAEQRRKREESELKESERRFEKMREREYANEPKKEDKHYLQTFSRGLLIAGKNIGRELTRPNYRRKRRRRRR